MSYQYQTTLLIVLFFCQNASGDRVLSCSHYSSNAKDQQQRNLQAECNFAGIRWSEDSEGQYKWCLTVSSEISEFESTQREKMLITCLKKKTSRFNKENSPNIPTKCKDPSGVYFPIKKIYSKSSYNVKPYAFEPFSDNGYIKYDFNLDGKTDYIFIERDDKTSIKLATCISYKEGIFNLLLEENKYSYDRKQTLFGLYENKTAFFQANSQAIRLEEDKLVISDNYHEHNWGGDVFRASYVYSLKLEDFILTSIFKDHYSGDGMTEDYESYYDFTMKRFESKTDCSNVQEYIVEEGGCLSQNKSGEITLKEELPSLYEKPVNRYGFGVSLHLIPDNKKLDPYDEKL